MAVELTIAQAKKHPASFMYVFASDKFLSLLNKKYANIIRAKRANQNKVLALSAQKYNTTKEAYTEAIREAFISIYACTPAEALVTLAKGGEVAGKNWKEGVYGIGAVGQTTFYGNSDLTVDTSNGHIYKNGNDVTDNDKTIYKDINGAATPYQLFYEDTTGALYMSQYNKSMKKYYAQSYSDPQLGITCDAKSGKETSASDSATVWENVLFGLETFINWLLSLFGLNTTDATATLTAENTLPDQTADGFVVEAGVGEAGAILLALAAGGALLATGGKKKKADSNK